MAYLVLHIGYLYALNLKEFRQQFIQFVDEIFINIFLNVHKKSLNIPDDKEEDFNINISF